jgi:hypothetical protein
MIASTAFAAVFTTNKTGTAVNQNIFNTSTDVYISGGPQNTNHSGLADGTYFFQVTDPSGKQLLSADNAVCRQLKVAGGVIIGASSPCPHAIGSFNPANGMTPVQLVPFSTTDNPGLEFKVWLIAQTSSTSVSTADPKVINFSKKDSFTDNFKVQVSTVPPSGSCQPSSSLTVLVSGTNAVAYVPKGNWSVTPATGVSAVNIEGSAVTPTLIPTANVVNSCASNSLSGQTVCTANNTDVYLLSGTTLTNTLSSSGSGLLFFSGGACTNCGVAMDAIHNKAVIGLSLAGSPGFQFLDLGATPTLEPAFISPAGAISEDPLIDPIRNLLLSAGENNDYEITNISTSTSPAFFENPITGVTFELDSSGEDCTTGIALAPAEFSGPSQIFISDLTQAVFTAGTPGTWTAPSQLQNLSESFLAAGASGIAVAQGTHTGIVSGEFGGDEVTAIALPISSGTGTPAISDWVSCNIGNGFSNGFDPHTVTAYQSPNSNSAIGVLANALANSLAIINLNQMLNPAIVPRTAGGHRCAAGPLPSSVVSFVPVP